MKMGSRALSIAGLQTFQSCHCRGTVLKRLLVCCALAGVFRRWWSFLISSLAMILKGRLGPRETLLELRHRLAAVFFFPDLKFIIRDPISEPYKLQNI